MNAARRAGHPAGDLEFAASSSDRSRLSRLAAAGSAVALARGIYAVGATVRPDAVVRHHLPAIVAHVWPGAVICDRSALAGGQPVDGYLFVCHPEPPRREPLRLPGVKVVPRVGPGPLPGDMPMPAGLHLSGPVRQLVENVPRPGRPTTPPRVAGMAAVEDAIETAARTAGPGAVLRLLDNLDVIAGSFGAREVEIVRARLAALVGTAMTDTPASRRYAARLHGQPYDQARIDLLADVIATLQRTPPAPRSALGGADRWAWEPFFEAYFSNFIEGTEFGVDQARQIVLDGADFARPQDAHDVAATFGLVSDPTLAGQVPTSGHDLLDLLQSRHATLMAARPDKHPGRFKQQANYAGGYRFVEPDAVEGTLLRGFDELGPLVDPFQRAIATMFLITEAHPFDDGNGRLARLFANAELTHAGQIRIVIPTVYRNNYLAGLAGASNRAGQGQTLISVLDFAQRWTAAVDWSTYETADAQMQATNAYLDPGLADASGQRLAMPTY